MMKLEEKHINLLDTLPLNEWVSEYKVRNLPRSGITLNTFKALRDMGIIDIVSVAHVDKITDKTVARGYATVKVKPYQGWGGTNFIKKLVSDYRTRDYEVIALKRQMEQLTEKLHQLES